MTEFSSAAQAVLQELLYRYYDTQMQKKPRARSHLCVHALSLPTRMAQAPVHTPAHTPVYLSVHALTSMPLYTVRVCAPKVRMHLNLCQYLQICAATESAAAATAETSGACSCWTLPVIGLGTPHNFRILHFTKQRKLTRALIAQLRHPVARTANADSV